MKRIFILLAFACFGAQLFSQSEVSGVITDANSGEPLPGATVIIKGTETGAVANLDGIFSIEVLPESILLVSFIGYIPEEVTVGTQKRINVSLIPSLQSLDEVVVTALGIKREKKALGYSVQDIKGDELDKTQQPNLVNALAGKIAGVQIVNSSGSIGASSVIKIRGNKSFSGNSEPLFVVDGTPIINSSNNGRSSSDVNIDFGNAAMDIDPANIESISVLKGPNAAALYGSRGANGVVMITTKSGKSNKKGIGVEFSSSVSMDKAYFFPAYQNDYGQGLGGSEYKYKNHVDLVYGGDFSQYSYNEYVDENSFRWDLEGNAVNLNADESWGGRLDAGLLIDQMHGVDQPWISKPDNVKNFFETGLSVKNNLALSTGNEFASTRITLTHQDSKGIIPNTDQKLINIGTNSSIKLGKKLTATVSGNYVELENENLPSLGRNFRNPFYALNGWFGRQVDLDYVEDHYEDIMNVNGEPMAFNWMMGYTNQHPNPYWTLYKNTMSRHRKRFYGNVSLNYEIAPWISLMVKGGTDTYNETRDYVYHQYTRRDWTLFDEPINGAFQNKVKLADETNFDMMLMVDKQLSEKFSLAATIGANARSSQTKTSTLTANELVTPDVFIAVNIKDQPEVGYYIWRKKTSSVFGTANLGYNNYLFLDLALRGDWSSTLPPDNWNYWYPSASMGFIFTDAFNIESPIMQYGKVRAGYAVAGNDAAPYQTSQTINSLDNTFNDVNLYYLSTTLASPTLKPEMTKSFETGLEMKFLGNRLGFDLTLYKSNTFNQLMSVPVEYSSGYNNWYKNAGNIENRGIELQMYGTPVSSGSGLKWNINFNWWKNKNEVVELEDGLEDLALGTSYSNAGIYLKARPGEPWGAIYGYKRARDENGNLLITSSGYPIAEDSLTIIGNVQPEWEAGLRNTFSYKNFNLSAMLRFRKGGDVVSVTKSIGQKTGLLEVTAADGIRENGMVIPGVFEEGAIDNEGNDVSGQPNTKVIAAQDYWGSSRNYSELSIFDGSYLKLSEVTFGYRIPSDLSSKVKIQDATITFFARNLAILWIHESNDANIDPEVSAGSSISGTGLEESQIPAPRTLGLKLDIKF